MKITTTKTVKLTGAFLVLSLLAAIFGVPGGYSGAEARLVFTVPIAGDGKTDATAAINQTIVKAAAVGGIVYIPKGVYMVDAVSRIKLMSGVDIYMGSQTVLKVIPNSSEYYAVLNISNVSNCKITSGVIVGDKYTHLGTTGEWGRGVYIVGSDNITVDGTVARECWGDGFYIGIGTGNVNSTNITLQNVVGDNNRRQGLSIASGENILVKNSTFKNTSGGTANVGAGIDIEPNTLNEKLQNVVLQDVTTSNNVAAGIIINLVKFNGNTDANKVSITINNHKDTGSDRGMFITDAGAIVKGQVDINNPVWTDSRRNGLTIMNHRAASFAINVNSPTIINANTTATKSYATASAIAFYSWDTNTIGGNVKITNVSVPTAGNTRYVYFVYSGASINPVTLPTPTIVDPILNGKILYTSDPTHVKIGTVN